MPGLSDFVLVSDTEVLAAYMRRGLSNSWISRPTL